MWIYVWIRKHMEWTDIWNCFIRPSVGGIIRMMMMMMMMMMMTMMMMM